MMDVSAEFLGSYWWFNMVFIWSILNHQQWDFNHIKPNQQWSLYIVKQHQQWDFNVVGLSEIWRSCQR
jgi:hypothetical protein